MMTEPCTVRRVTGTHEVAGRDVPLLTDVWSGLCKVQSNTLVNQAPEVGGATVTVIRYELHLPVTAGPFEVGDVAEVPGRTFRVAGLHDKTWQTAQRLPVDEVP